MFSVWLGPHQHVNNEHTVKMICAFKLRKKKKTINEQTHTHHQPTNRLRLGWRLSFVSLSVNIINNNEKSIRYASNVLLCLIIIHSSSIQIYFLSLIIALISNIIFINHLFRFCFLDDYFVLCLYFFYCGYCSIPISVFFILVKYTFRETVQNCLLYCNCTNELEVLFINMLWVLDIESKLVLAEPLDSVHIRMLYIDKS